MPMKSQLIRRKSKAPTTNRSHLSSSGPEDACGEVGCPSILHIADAFNWYWDLKTSRVYSSTQLCALLDIHRNEVPSSMERFLQFVHPDDRDKFRKNLPPVPSVNPVDQEIRLLRRSGKVLCVHMQSFPICDRAGEVVTIVALFEHVKDLPSLGARARNRGLLLAQAEKVANFGTWEFDVKSRSAMLSAQLAGMLGAEPALPLPEEEYWNRVHSEDRPESRQIVNTAIAECRPFQFMLRYVSPNHGLRYHFVRGLSIADEDGCTKSIIGVTLDCSDQTHAESELHRLSQRLLRARDEERRNIARDLHESTGQTLAALKMTLGRLRQTIPERNAQACRLLSSTVDLVENAVREVRTISYLMHPPMLDEAGLRSALHWYAKGFSERSGLSVSVDVPDDFGRKGREIETTLFRIVQEALTNLHRYSGSRTATIRVSCHEGLISAEIRDEGCGLPVRSPVTERGAPSGVGIVGMRERVKQLNGTFEIESGPGKGTCVRVLLPEQRRNAHGRLARPRARRLRGLAQR